MNTHDASFATRATRTSSFLFNSTILEESYQNLNKDHITNLNELIQSLEENAVPGPQLFRLKNEFSRVLGRGGESEVLGVATKVLEKIRQVDPWDTLKWPVEGIAIKKHSPRGIGSSKLGSRFLAAKREVLALAPLFKKHPNIVQLLGWGICLDTLENPSEESLQIPLLILERAETDLDKFLNEVTPETAPTRGYWARLRQMGIPSTQDAEMGHTNPVNRPYGLLRQLCIDIGNGLEALHENGFTHGDLKPQNVLVFKARTGWVAKLCDFGCARGIIDPNNAVEGVAYAGTPGWLPPEACIEGALVKHELLQQCDIYTYGLLVWSVFCGSGKSTILRQDKSQLEPGLILTLAISRVQEILLSHSENLASTITSILNDALQVKPEGRPKTPWKHWQTGSGNVTIDIYTLWESFQSWAKSCLRKVERSAPEDPRPMFLCPPTNIYRDLSPSLTPANKRSYENREWWPVNINPGSREALSEDDDYSNLSAFQESRRKLEVDRLLQFFAGVLSEGPYDPNNQQDLYCYARFRSRMRLIWWNDHAEVENIVKKALTARTIPDFSTFAWLCRGEVGIWEVQHLPRDSETWDTLFNPDILNESERLERFLMLMQSGARVEAKLYSSRPWSQRRSILVEYVRRCRPTTVNTIMEEICRRFNKVKDQSHILLPTRCYITGIEHDGRTSRSATAIDDFLSEEMFNAVAQLRKHGFLSSNGTEATSTGRPSSGEISPLLQPQVPLGWRALINKSFSANFYFYRDVVTGSVTLELPTRSLLLIRQVPLGYRNPNNKEPCYIDITRFIRPETLRAVKGITNQEVGKRFPLYDDEWFKMEQYDSLSSEDVLKAISDPWRLPSFADRIKAPSFASIFGVLVVFFLLFVLTLLILLIMFTPKRAWITVLIYAIRAACIFTICIIGRFLLRVLSFYCTY